MVRIDGEWYCVDVTWNDPVGGGQYDPRRHKYFNVTSEFMRNNNHAWDESKTPVADAGKLFFD
jgi:transglutaminase/protease-like cytokinesis protein 3